MTSSNDAYNEEADWLDWQSEIFMAGDDKFAYRLRNIAELLRAAPPSNEPVAWRYRYSPKGTWKYADDKADCNPTPNYEQQPLYAAPQSESTPQSASERSVRLDECKRIMAALDAYQHASDYGPPIEERMRDLDSCAASTSKESK